MTTKPYNPTYVEQLLSQLISYPTTTDNVSAIAECLAYIKGEVPQSYHIQSFEHKGVHSLYLHNQNKILLHGHIDVVPADPTQYQAKNKAGKLYGRGALDMKGAIAVMIHLLQNTSGYDLLLTGDEETGGKNGTGYLIQSNQLKPYKYIITGEPTDLAVATEEKGVLWLNAIFHGKSAHAAKPWEGINPLYKMEKLLKHLKKKYSYTQPTWKTTVTPTIVSSANGQNQVAQSVVVKIDSRYIPGDEPQKIIEEIKALCDEIEVAHIEPPLASLSSPYTQKHVELSAKPETRMHWATDARYFGDTPAVIYGPKGEGMHSATEYVELDSLKTMYETLTHLVTNLR